MHARQTCIALDKAILQSDFPPIEPKGVRQASPWMAFLVVALDIQRYRRVVQSGQLPLLIESDCLVVRGLPCPAIVRLHQAPAWACISRVCFVAREMRSAGVGMQYRCMVGRQRQASFPVHRPCRTEDAAGAAAAGVIVPPEWAILFNVDFVACGQVNRVARPGIERRFSVNGRSESARQTGCVGAWAHALVLRRGLGYCAGEEPENGEPGFC